MTSHGLRRHVIFFVLTAMHGMLSVIYGVKVIKKGVCVSLLQLYTSPSYRNETIRNIVSMALFFN